MNKRPGAGGYFTTFSVGRFDTLKKWTQSDLKICENEGSIRSKTNENWSIGSKIDTKWK